VVANSEWHEQKHNREADEQNWVVLVKRIAFHVVEIHFQSKPEKEEAPARQLLAVSWNALLETRISLQQLLSSPAGGEGRQRTCQHSRFRMHAKRDMIDSTEGA
jgi:hypothetical protein